MTTIEITIPNWFAIVITVILVVGAYPNIRMLVGDLWKLLV